MTPHLKRAVCPYDCPDTCGLLVEVADDRALRVTGDPDHPYSQGKLCAKMNRYHETVHSPRRLTTPLLRRGAKGSGDFVPISWDEALATIVARWQAIIAESGAEAILPYSYAGTMGLVQRNAGHPFFHRLGASRLARTICAPAKEAGWKAVMGETPAPHPNDMLHSDLIILWGINAAATSIHTLHQVRAAKENGTAVWLIDTYRTATAALADRVFLVKPGSDGALALGLMHLLQRDNLLDRDFLARHVQGFDQLREQVLPAYPPETVSRLTGLSVTTLGEMAQAYGRARAPLIRLGSGLSRYANGAMTVRCIVTLPALVGAYAKRGGGCFSSVATGGAFATSEIVREDLQPRPTRLINMNRLGHALTELSDPPLRSLYVYHANPAAVSPDQNAIIAGLMREDLFTVVHERFLTDTARYADLVLPATSSLEHDDIYRSFGHYCIQRGRPVIPAVGESRSNWQVFTALAAAFGFTEEIFRRDNSAMVEHLLAVSAPLRFGVDETALASGAAVELPGRAWQGGSFATPSGQIEIYQPALAEPLPRFIPPRGGDEPLWLMTAPAVGLLNSSFCERDDIRQREGKMTLRMSPEDAAARGLRHGDLVQAANTRGTVLFHLAVSDELPAGVVAAEGVWWSEFAPGPRTVNALTSQYLTDLGEGSTFYDTTVEVTLAPALERP